MNHKFIELQILRYEQRDAYVRPERQAGAKWGRTAAPHGETPLRTQPGRRRGPSGRGRRAPGRCGGTACPPARPAPPAPSAPPPPGPGLNELDPSPPPPRCCLQVSATTRVHCREGFASFTPGRLEEGSRRNTTVDSIPSVCYRKNGRSLVVLLTLGIFGNSLAQRCGCGLLHCAAVRCMEEHCKARTPQPEPFHGSQQARQAKPPPSLLTLPVSPPG